MSINYSELTKEDVIIGAYSQMRISGLTSNPSPEDLDTALMRLENMAREFSSRKMDAGYNFEVEPEAQSFLGVDPMFMHAYETNLAIRLIPDFNKEVPQALYAQASQSLSNLSARTALVSQTPYPRRQARGSGNTLRYYRWDRFYRTSSPNPETQNKLRVGDINSYFEDFAGYLRENEDIASFVITPDRNLEITASSIDGTRINYTVSAPSNDATSAQWVDIQITTTLGRVDKRRVFFDISE